MIPNPYVLLGAAALWALSVIGAAVWWGHHVELGYKAAISRQNADAEKLRADLTAVNAARDAAASDFARKLDEEHNHGLQQIRTAGDTAERAYADKLRRIAASRPSCPSAGTPEAAHPGSAEDATARERDRLSDEIGRDIGEVRTAAENLKLFAKTCVAWAHEVGR